MRRMYGVLAAALLAVGCGGDDEGTNNPVTGRFGEVTTAVLVVNPRINQGSTTSVTPGSQREGVQVATRDMPGVRTDATGLALLQGLPVGTVTLDFNPGTTTLQVVQEKELYDVVVAYKDGQVRPLFAPVRYPLGGQVVRVAPGGSIAQAAATDGAIVLLEPGTYPGNFELRSEGVLVFGAWSPTQGPLSVIQGNVTVLGGNNRMRGVKVDGRLTSSANSLSVAFSDLASATITGNGVTLLRNRFTSGQASVPSSSAVLVDNSGIP